VYTYRHWEWLLLDVTQEFRREMQRELQAFVDPLENQVNRLLSAPLPGDWRSQLSKHLDAPSAQGFQLTPHGRQTLEWWVEAWARKRGFDDRGTGQSRQQSETLASSAAAKESKAAFDSWPALTPEESRRFEERQSFWYRLRPRKLSDGFWITKLETNGRNARDRLLVTFRALEELGRMAASIDDPEKFDLERFSTQRDRVQQAYDAYIRARAEVYRSWASFLNHEWVLSSDVERTFRRIDNGLPYRLPSLTSPFDAELVRAHRAADAAISGKVRRTEIAYEVVSWADFAISVVELATLVGTAKTAGKLVFQKALAKGLSLTVARSAAIGYGIAHVATAVATGAVVAGVLPPVLAYAGLNESAVRVGISVFGAFFTIVGAKSMGARPASSVPTFKPLSPRSAARKFKRLPKQQPPLSPQRARIQRGVAFNHARSSHYPYNEVPIVKSGGGRGRPNWLDSYDPTKGEIVFRRDTQFSEISLKTAMAYLQEFTKKYPPGSIIANVPSAGELAGRRLEGKMFFEVPVQWKRIPELLLLEAKRRDIQIRDTNGKVYELPTK
jgi:hypothetical protein